MELPQGYELTETLYDGERSSVVRARRVSDGLSVVLKQTIGGTVTARQITRYRNEYDLLRRVESEGVIKALDLIRTGGRLTLVLEDFSGRPVKQWREQESPELIDVLRFAVEVAASIGDVHAAGIIHRDVSAYNVLYDVASRRAKLIDFGIASRWSTSEAGLQPTETLEGTLPYLAPCQTGRMNRGVDHRADWYSFGITLYELLCGRLPLESDDPLEIVHFHLAGRPEPPADVDSKIPAPVSDIVMKLIQKAPEDRYQSADGLIADLQQCIGALERNEPIARFELGTSDYRDTFKLPQKLYGRSDEIAAMQETLSRVVTGSVEVLSISGEAGVGKTALAFELYEPTSRAGGFFVVGRYDELHDERPFSALLDAIDDLISQILTESEESVADWRAKILEALEGSASVLIEVIPSLEHFLGPQPQVAALTGIEAQNRFKRLIRNLMYAFADSSHPLVILLDNLQWADAESLDLLSSILAFEYGESLLLIGAHRSSETDGAEHIRQFVDDLEERGTSVQRIGLEGLDSRHIAAFAADALQLRSDIEPLARALHEKTGGNPFFAREFMRALYDTGLISFDAKRKSFAYDMDGIRAAGITENVAEFLTEMLQRVPVETFDALVAASVIGSEFDLTTLASTLEVEESDAAQMLEAALARRIVIPLSKLESLDPDDLSSPLVYRRYAFAHGRIQHAAYEMIDSAARDELHLKLGRALVPRIAPEPRLLFDAVNHLNHGVGLVGDPTERDTFAELNLDAGNRARLATAYPLAARYYRHVIEFLGGEDAWRRARDVMAVAHERLAEALILLGDSKKAYEVIDLALQRSESRVERASLHSLKIQADMSSGKMPEATAYALRAARDIGMDLPQAEDDLAAAAREALNDVLTRTADAGVRSLLDLPSMKDQEDLATMKLLLTSFPAAFQTDHQVYTLFCCKLVLLSLERGNSVLSARVYASFGALLSAGLGKHREANEFTTVGVELAHKLGDTSIYAAVNFLRAAFSSHWMEPLDVSIGLFADASRYGLQTGDHSHAMYSEARRLSHLHRAGAPLEDVVKEGGKILALFRQVGETVNVAFVEGRLQLASWLMGQRPCGNRLGTADKSEDELTEKYRVAGNLSFLSDWCAALIQQRYFAGEYAEAHEIAEANREIVPFNAAFVTHQEWTLFHALSIAQLLTDASAPKGTELRAQFDDYLATMTAWAAECPANFECARMLLEAERARIDNDDATAFELYDTVVERAAEGASPHFEALAGELAARFWNVRNKRHFAAIYVERAINAYDVWRAQGKAKDLREEFGLKRSRRHTVSVTSNATLLGGSSHHGDALDLGAMIKASQAIASEILLDKLLERMMDIVLENSGAERGVLVLERDGQFFVEAIEEIGDLDTRVRLGEPIQQTAHLSRGIANFVMRVGEHVVLDEPAERGRFRRDSYVVNRRPKSVLCAPVTYKGKLRGVIYLENNHVAGAFTKNRLEALNILMSQVAVSIENAMLYEQQESQNKSIERANEALRLEVAERKKAELELSRYKDHLEELVTQRTQELERAQGRLVDMSRQAGMAEVAAGVLHNVGNVMNSVNVGVHLTQDAVKGLQVERLKRIAALLVDNSERLAEFLTADPVGLKVPEYLSKLSDALVDDQEAIRTELDGLSDHIEHMKQIIAAQQSYAKVAGVSESCSLEEIVESALAISAAGLRSYEVEVVRDYERLGHAFLDRHQIMQIVVNLISNAKHALGESDVAPRRLTIRLQHCDESFRVEVSDNGVGIEAANLKKIFNHGFTTKSTGHGFGLHNSANAAQQMDGSLDVFSDGPGKGATFVLTIPALMADDATTQQGAA